MKTVSNQKSNYYKKYSYFYRLAFDVSYSKIKGYNKIFTNGIVLIKILNDIFTQNDNLKDYVSLYNL
jgi:hypothetical protein